MKTNLSVKQLQDISNIIRRDCAISTTKAGSGHLTTCLSCAEIMSVLFFDEMKYDVNNPHHKNNDEFILSKGHAAPALYSCLKRARCIKDDLNDLRKLGSNLEGHPMPRSLDWIKAATGSLGQGLSIGVGMALAAKLQKRKFRTYVLLGDGEIAEGSIYEACQLAEHYQLNNLAAIVDVNRQGQTGETILGHDMNSYKKRFEGFGWKVLVIDGHNIKEILKAFDDAKKSNKPVIILAKTFKGRGVSFMENKVNWHAKIPNSIELEKALKEIPDSVMSNVKIKKPSKDLKKRTGKNKVKIDSYKIGNSVATRDAFGRALVNLCASDKSVLAVDADVANSTRLKFVKGKTPNQFVECYIAEQDMIGVVLGLSKKGFNVFAASFGAFLTRAHDQLRMSALSNADFTINGSHAGVSIGPDGASQMGLEDIAMFRDLPNSIVFYSSDAVSTQKIVHMCNSLKGIKYIRTTRDKTPILYKKNEKFNVGDFKVLKKSNEDRVVLVGSGITVYEALKAYDELKKKKINVAVVDLYCVKPFNGKKFVEFVEKHGKKVIISEDHYPEGGIGEMLSDVLIGTNKKIEVKHLAIREIPHSGKTKELLEKYGIDWKGYVKSVGEIK